MYKHKGVWVAKMEAYYNKLCMWCLKRGRCETNRSNLLRGKVRVRHGPESVTRKPHEIFIFLLF